MTRVMMRMFSCYCTEACASGQWASCRKEWTDCDGWNDDGRRMRIRRLTETSRAQNDPRLGHQGTRLSKLQAARLDVGKTLRKGDFFAVPTGPESKDLHCPDHPYWVLEVTKEPWKVEQTFYRMVDGATNEQEKFCKGDWVVGVRHYSRSPVAPRLFYIDTQELVGREPELVNCYLCVDKGFEVSVAPVEDKTKGLLLLSEHVDKQLTRLVLKGEAPVRRRADANKENVMPTTKAPHNRALPGTRPGRSFHLR